MPRTLTPKNSNGRISAPAAKGPLDSRELALLRAIFIEIVRTIDRITRGKAGGLQH